MDAHRVPSIVGHAIPHSLRRSRTMSKFTERDIEAVRAAAERMARAANKSLAIANTSRNEPERHSRTLIAKVNLQRLKELSIEYPFLNLTMLAEFDVSLRQVEQETRAIAASGTSEPQVYPKRDVDPFLRMSLSNQCKSLEIPLDVIRLQRHGREWLFDGSSFKKPEQAAFAHFEAQGFSGTYCEGSAPLMLMKCAALDYLAQVNTFKSRADACVRFFEAQCWLHAHLAHYIIDEIRAATEETIRTNFREIVSQPTYRAVYPIMEEEGLVAIWRAMSPPRLAQLAQFILENPDYRAGWPDLTLARDNVLRFVEVKTTDRLHASQKNVISEVLKPWGTSVSILQIKAAR